MKNGVSKAISVALLVLTGCSTATASMEVGPVATADLPTYSYRLSGGDKLRVIVFGEPDLSGEYTVGGSGALALPLIGEIAVSGLTSTQLQARIAERLAADYIKEPRVAVELLNARPFYILGEVNRPGEYPFTDGLTIAAAVARAGGYTYRATKRTVAIRHVGDAKADRYALAPTTTVAPGDTITVMERWF